MPTFMFFRNKTRLDKLQGADTKALEEKVKQHYGEEGGEGEEAGVKGMMDLNTFIDKVTIFLSHSHCIAGYEHSTILLNCMSELFRFIKPDGAGAV